MTDLTPETLADEWDEGRGSLVPRFENLRAALSPTDPTKEGGT